MPMFHVGRPFKFTSMATWSREKWSALRLLLGPVRKYERGQEDDAETPIVASPPPPPPLPPSPPPPFSSRHVNDLPAEILTNIFVFAAFSHDRVLHTWFKRNLASFPLLQSITFCGVSSFWRDVALATPQLWTQYSICLPPEISRERVKEKAGYLETCVGRSGSLPLTLYLPYGLGNTIDDMNANNPLYPFVEALIRHASRWESVQFGLPPFGRELPAGYGMRNFMDLNVSWINLRSIYIYHCLSTLRFNDSILWDKLTHLHIRPLTPCKLVVDILERCPNLVDLQVATRDLAVNQPELPFIRHGLLRFNLMAMDASADFRILSALSLPSLVQLRLQLAVPSYGDAIPSTLADLVTGLLTRSECKLETFTTCDIPFSSSEIIRCLELESCQSLTAFAVRYGDLGPPTFRWDDVLRRLTVRPSNPVPLCPKLLFLRCEQVECNNPKALIDMAASRIYSQRGTRMEYLCLQVFQTEAYDKHLLDLARKSGLRYFVFRTEPFLSFLACAPARWGAVVPVHIIPRS